ncbi:hypothetical protein C0J52_26910 [Blattella germanica]|nr:hypothetical protein C0J52_26910 [Blattella germanica]
MVLRGWNIVTRIYVTRQLHQTDMFSIRYLVRIKPLVNVLLNLCIISLDMLKCC